MTDETKEKYKKFSHTFRDEFEEKNITVEARFKRPDVQSANRATKGMLKSPGSAFAQLCMDVVHPDDKQNLTDAFKTYPGMASTFGNELLKSMGFGELGN